MQYTRSVQGLGVVHKVSSEVGCKVNKGVGYSIQGQYRVGCKVNKGVGCSTQGQYRGWVQG